MLQLKPVLLAAGSYEEGYGKKTRVPKTTFYNWMQDEGFMAEFERQRSKIAEAAFGMISQRIEKAVTTLIAMLTNGLPVRCSLFRKIRRQTTCR